MNNYVWHKQAVSPLLQIIDCPVYDPIHDFHRDPTGVYVLIRTDQVNSIIEVAICDAKHTLTHAFRGRKSQDLYDAIFDYEQRHQLQWFSRNDHAAYLGKELKKAEFALLEDEPYVQE